ncbi:hypothetical protein Tco_0060935 [Tanacetum coccineum]
MIGDYSCSCVDELHANGASWSIEVDTGELIGSTGLGAAVTGTRETTVGGGLKNSSNIGWNKISQSFLWVTYWEKTYFLADRSADKTSEVLHSLVYGLLVFPESYRD